MGDIGDVIDGREIQVLETAEDIQARREQVLARFAHFKEAAKYRRDKLEDSREYQYFKRDADELEMWINEKIQICSQDDTYRDSTSVQVNAMLLGSRLSMSFSSSSSRRRFRNMKHSKKKSTHITMLWIVSTNKERERSAMGTSLRHPFK
jgi:hypothetical protein